MCGFGIMLAVLAACASGGMAKEEEQDAPVVLVKENVWTLLARGDSERAKNYFLGQVDVNATDNQGKTPLHYAAENKDPFLASFFISLGAVIDALDNEGRTPLAISTEKLDAPTAKVLAKAVANIHHPMTDRSGLPTSPARAGVSESREFLAALLNPATLASTDSSGRTILHLAAEAGNAQAAETILKEQKNFNQRDNNGKTALDIALERTGSADHAKIAEKIILAGAVSRNPLFVYFAPAVKSSNYNIRSSGGMAPLHYIAREGYTGYLAFMLEKNADVNIKNASGATPLHEAARSGNITVMKTLLDAGAEVNAQDAKGNSALHIAIPPESHLTAIRLFLERGINLNLRDEHGDTPLHIAIILNRYEEIVRALLEGGADINIRDVDGKTPLYLAIERERINYIPLLLAHRADIFASDNTGMTPYEKALRENRSMVLPLITDETVFQNDSAGNTMLHITVGAGGSTSILNIILDHKASVNAANKTGDTSLTMAVRANQEAAGTLLLSRGADIFTANAKGESPLYLAFPPPGRDSAELRQWMLTPQTLSLSDGLGNTALHYAAQWRIDNWIPLLIRLGAKTESSNATGETPLFMAVKNDSPSTIRVLAANGAQLSSRDILGNSALHAVIRWNALYSAEALIDLGLDINSHALNGKTPLHEAIRLGMTDMETLLLRRGADIESRDLEGNTPFMEAVLSGNITTAELLAGMGADPDTRNFRGDTPLHITSAMETTDLATLLLGWGASIHAKNAQGRTPYQNALVSSPVMVRTFITRDRLNLTDENGSSLLHIAVRERASLAIIRTIMDLGVRISSVDAEGRTPVRIALDLNLWETAKLLSDSGADLFITARDGRNAAEIALGKGETAIKAIFSGRAINAKDQSGNTILHYAARQGNTGNISLLLSLGANKSVKNIAVESPEDIARRWNNSEVAEMLK